MDRMEEYRALRKQLENTPARLEYTVQRAEARARKRRISRLFKAPAATLAGVFAAFALLVNLSVPFALACGRIPFLNKLAAAVAMSPSLKAAVEHDYVQIMDLTQSQDGLTMTVSYIIVDQRQINIFYTVQGGEFPRYTVLPSIRGAQGEEMEGYSVMGGAPAEPHALQKYVVDFMTGDVPSAIRLSCDVIGLKEESREVPVQAGAERTDDAAPEVLTTFTFDLRFDPMYTESGQTVAVNRWILLDGQRILVKDVEIYPTHIRLNLRDDEENTAWLRCLEFYLQDEAGNRYEKVSSGITATGSEDSHFMAGHRLESSYFGDAKHLAVYITGAAWLDKDMEYVEVDLDSGDVGPLPDWMRMEKVEHLGKDRYRISLSAPCRGSGGYYQLLRWDYLDQEGVERSFDGMSSSGAQGDPARFVAFVTLEDYPYHTVRLGLSETRITALNTPLEIIIK